jgi:hypothetical protein
MDADRRRTFTAPPPRGRLRDGDSAGKAQRLKAAAWSYAGVAIGLMAGFAAGLPLMGVLLGGLIGGATIYGLTMLIASGTGRLAGMLYGPSGRGTPGRREYSLAESFCAQGRYEDAISAFELAVGEHPDDAVPYLRIARIYRDELRKPDDAERWFKRAQRDATLGDGQKVLVVRELVELYYKQGTPSKAAPVLARAVEEFSGRPEEAWARQELAGVKASIAGEERNVPPGADP